jgi:hypothetical protein
MKVISELYFALIDITRQTREGALINLYKGSLSQIASYIILGALGSKKIDENVIKEIYRILTSFLNDTCRRVKNLKPPK